MKNLIILFMLINFTEVREVLKHVETDYNPEAIGDNGASFGILQIQQGAIDDVNEKFGTSYTHEDAFDVQCAEEIFDLYILRWSKHLEKKEGRKATVEDVVRIWNGGPGGYKKNSTLKYLARYKNKLYLYNDGK
jgi:hypothetical protein